MVPDRGFAGARSVSGYTVALDLAPDAAIRAAILDPLVAYNERVGGPSQAATIAVTVVDGAGMVVGGLWGRMAYEFLFVELLSVGVAKGQGLGRQVMALAEAEARRRGLRGMWLDTWTFQAPGFYQKLGFEECGRIRDYPAGHDRIFYMKRFDRLAEGA